MPSVNEKKNLLTKLLVRWGLSKRKGNHKTDAEKVPVKEYREIQTQTLPRSQARKASAAINSAGTIDGGFENGGGGSTGVRRKTSGSSRRASVINHCFCPPAAGLNSVSASAAYRHQSQHQGSALACNCCCSCDEGDSNGRGHPTNTAAVGSHTLPNYRNGRNLHQSLPLQHNGYSNVGTTTTTGHQGICDFSANYCCDNGNFVVEEPPEPRTRHNLSSSSSLPRRFYRTYSAHSIRQEKQHRHHQQQLAASAIEYSPLHAYAVDSESSVGNGKHHQPADCIGLKQRAGCVACSGYGTAGGCGEAAGHYSDLSKRSPMCFCFSPAEHTAAQVGPGCQGYAADTICLNSYCCEAPLFDPNCDRCVAAVLCPCNRGLPVHTSAGGVGNAAAIYRQSSMRSKSSAASSPRSRTPTVYRQPSTRSNTPSQRELSMATVTTLPSNGTALHSGGGMSTLYGAMEEPSRPASSSGLNRPINRYRPGSWRTASMRGPATGRTTANYDASSSISNGFAARTSLAAAAAKSGSLKSPAIVMSSGGSSNEPKCICSDDDESPPKLTNGTKIAPNGKLAEQKPVQQPMQQPISYDHLVSVREKLIKARAAFFDMKQLKHRQTATTSTPSSVTTTTTTGSALTRAAK